LIALEWKGQAEQVQKAKSKIIASNLFIQVQKAKLGLFGSLVELKYCSARQA